MARIVLISPYLKGGQNAAKLAQRTRYFATRPGVELLADEHSTLPATKKQCSFIDRLVKSFPTSKELIEYEDYLANPTQGNASAFIQQTWEDYVEALDQKENFIDYISHRPGVQKDGEHGLWDTNGKVQNLSKVVREVAEHTGNVWTPVVALRRQDAERLGYDNAKNWRALINASVCEIAAAYKIQPDHLRWYAAFHQKPQQMHIHMIIFSTDPKEGYLTKDGIRQVKSAFARRIYQADRMHVYQQKDQSRDALQREARRAMAECIVQLKCGTIRDPKLEQLITELADRLQETCGRKVYGYLPPRTKAIVDAIVEELAKDQQVSAAYEVWQRLYEQICLDYNEQLPKRLPLSQQKEFKTVRNMVIQETLQWMAERQQYAEAMVRKPAAPDTPERSAPTESTPTAFPEPENPGAPPAPENADTSADTSRSGSTDLPPSEGERPVYAPPQSDVQSKAAGSTYDPPTVSEAVVRMLHHMSRIFEDNSRTDRIHRGLQIDRKRRQELQRKRLAMGHKADDHEEQSLSSLR